MYSSTTAGLFAFDLVSTLAAYSEFGKPCRAQHFCDNTVTLPDSYLSSVLRTLEAELKLYGSLG